MTYPAITANQNSMYLVPMIQLEEREEVVSPIVWLLVALVALLALSIILITAMSIYCISRGGSFTGQWGFKDWGFNVSFACTQ